MVALTDMKECDSVEVWAMVIEAYGEELVLIRCQTCNKALVVVFNLGALKQRVGKPSGFAFPWRHGHGVHKCIESARSLVEVE